MTFLFGPSSAWAANFTGAIDNDWHKGGNWSTGIVPNGGGGVFINSGKTADVTQTTAFNGGFEIDHNATINIKNGATLTQTGDNQWWGRPNDTWMINITEGATLTNTNGNAHFGTGTNSTSTVNLDNGTWNHFDQIKSNSTGNKWYTNMANGSMINAAHFWLRNDNASNSAVLKGSGTVTVSQTFRSNGRVEADGGTLNFVSWASLSDDQNYAIAMPDGNRAGWYAANQGRLQLPTLSLSGTTKAWGEEVNDATLDIVNSLRLTGGGISGTVDIELVALDLVSIQPAIVLLADPIGVWNISAGAGGVTGMEIRYDDNAIVVNENDLKLLFNGGAGWTDITNVLDMGNNRISGSTGLGAGLYAVAEGFTSSVVPEPSSLLLATLGLLCLGCGRRRRKQTG